jgi:hypothetical protein
MHMKNKKAVVLAAAVLCAGSAWAAPATKALVVTKANVAAFNPFSVSKHPAKVVVITPPAKNTKDNKSIKPATIIVPVITSTPAVAPIVVSRPVYTPVAAPTSPTTVVPTGASVRPPYIPPPRSAFLPPAGTGLGP